MNNTLDYKTIKATNDLKTALDSFKELNDQQRVAVITAVFGADAVKQIVDIYNRYSIQNFPQ